MEKHLPRDVRNIALAGHAGGGKTSLLEAILHVAGVNERLGRVDDGTATTDFDPDEIQRKHSIHLALAPCDWPPGDSQKRELHWVDTPGHPDFFGDFIAALRVVDDVLLVTPAQSSGGLEFGMESTWERAKTAGKAEAVFINKMDRERADFYGAVEALRSRFGNHVVPATLPIGDGETFEGVIDLVTMKAYYGGGKDVRVAEVPADQMSLALEWREKLLEVAAEGDDALIEKYLGGEELTEEEIERGIHEDLLSGHIVPVFCGSATRCIGIQPLLTHLALEFESPDEAEKECDPNAPFSALVFKTLADPYVGKLTCFRVKTGRITPDTTVWNANKQREERLGPLFMLCGKRQVPVKELVAGDLGTVAKLASTETSDTLCDKNNPVQYPPIPFPTPTYAVAASPKTKQDEDKLGIALARVAEEDPAFRHERHPETGETLLLGQGETHLDLIAGRLARFGSKVDTRLPRIPYRETLTRSARAQGRHKKQTGGRGQFGDCWLKVEPQTTGTGFVFVDKIVGGAIPRQWLPAVEKGVQESMGRGVLAGYPIVDVSVTCDDGSFHPVDSSEAAFHMAGIVGFQSAAKLAGPVILEPICTVTVTAPDAYTGDLMGDFNSRRGHVVGMEPGDTPGTQSIRAIVPQSELLRYAVELRSLGHGRASFCSQFSHYAELPTHLASPLIQEHEKRRAEGHHAHD